MSGPEFFQTGMGRKFYEGTMPTIAESLREIARELEEIRVELKRRRLDAEPKQDSGLTP